MHSAITSSAIGLALICGTASAQAQPPDAKAIVQQAVNAELAANRNDHSHWRYIDTRTDAENGAWAVVETADGALRRHTAEAGHAPSAATLQADDAAIDKFIRDASVRNKQNKDSAHDDKSAEELLNLLPQAFAWKVEKETPELITLSFAPDSSFHPPDMEARVMGQMAGELIVDRSQHRIRTMKGALSQQVDIGYGILGRMRKGGTFDVERRQTAPGLWQITETHVHIDGRALFFKTIGEQQDEVKTRFVQIPASTTLQQAAAMLREGPVAVQATNSVASR